MEKEKLSKYSNTRLLNSLSSVIKNVFIPLENKSNELKSTLAKFTSQVNHSAQQVSGTINIELPSPIEEISDAEAIKNVDLMLKYETSLVSLFLCKIDLLR